MQYDWNGGIYGIVEHRGTIFTEDDMFLLKKKYRSIIHLPLYRILMYIVNYFKY